MGVEKPGLAQLRSALEKYRRRRGHGKYPERLRQRACKYVEQRLHQGMTVQAIADELGISRTAVARWSPSRKSPRVLAASCPPSGELSLVPVAIKPELAEFRATRLEVDFPDGTRLQAFGIGLEAVGSAVEVLRRRR